MVDPEDILCRADRMCLEVARERGSLVAVLTRQGVRDDCEWAMFEHFRAMCSEGLLTHVGTRGTDSRRQGAERVAEFQATQTGLKLLRAVEIIESLQGNAERPSRRAGSRSSR